MIVVGIDPGEVQGAAVVLDGAGKPPHRVLWAQAWRQTAKGWVLTSPCGVQARAASLGVVGDLVATEAWRRGPGYRVVLEGLYLDALKKASRVLTLAEAAGKVVGPVESLAKDVLRPKATTWRGKVLRRPVMKADAAARYAVKCAPLLVEGLGELGGNEHACEAAAMAYYGVYAR